MDESLSDFQDIKPVRSQIKSITKPKTRRKKPTRPLQGQKDIRTLVKNKNDLVTYSNEFHQVCKQSGLDVDAEQLQLAIALSKSLQDSDSEPINISEELTSRERANKIRRTLQEYGFKVPCNKISIVKKRKPNKQYKLLLTSESERQQIVSDKYAEILLKNNSDFAYHCQQDNSQQTLYYKATNIGYSDIRNDNNFYIATVINKSLTKCFMLRDWAEIPGRPLSPKPEVNDFHFDNIYCTEGELDGILSGSIKSAQDIVKGKLNFYLNSNSFAKNQKAESSNLCEIKTVGTMNYNDNSKIMDVDDQSTILNNRGFISNIDSVKILLKRRSISPDIFDDGSDVEDLSNHVLNKPQTSCETYNKTAFMHLTKCVIPSTMKSLHEETVRKSNDFMEMTNCASNNFHQNTSDSIDLTQIYSLCKNNLEQPIKDDCAKMVDLTQSSDSNDLPIVQIGGTQNETHLENTVLLDTDYSERQNVEGAFNLINKATDKDSNNIYLITHDVRVEDTVVEIDDVNHAVNTTNDVNSVDVNCRFNNNYGICNENVDLTQSSYSSEELINEDFNIYCELGKKDDVSIDYDELLDKDLNNYNMSIEDFASSKIKLDELNSDSDNTYNQNTTPGNLKAMVKENSALEQFGHNNINFGEISLVDESSTTERSSISNIHKINDIDNYKHNSDYTENIHTVSNIIVNSKYPMANGKCSYDTPIKEINNKNIPDYKTPINNEFIVKTADVTPMLHYELMTSPERNKELKKYGIKPFKRKRAIQLLTYLYNQTHPIVHQCSSEELLSPSKKQKTDSDESAQTRMSNRGGSKNRFNDTCPRALNLIAVSPSKQSSSGLSPSTSSQISPLINPTLTDGFTQKMTKLSAKSRRKSIRLGRSPRKLSPNKLSSPDSSPKKLMSGIGNEVDIYLETNERPDIKEITCCSDDWVFQKQEKAKVQSCRVPLHIAFHNYVSCRKLLRESILCYNPVNIDTIHKDLVSYGYKYNPKDLLKFLDKKCITVKTINKARNKKI